MLHDQERRDPRPFYNSFTTPRCFAAEFVISQRERERARKGAKTLFQFPGHRPVREYTMFNVMIRIQWVDYNRAAMAARKGDRS